MVVAFLGYTLYSLVLLCVIFIIVFVFVWGFCGGFCGVFLCLLDGLATCVDQNKSPHKIYTQNRIISCIRSPMYFNGIWYIKMDHNFI